MFNSETVKGKMELWNILSTLNSKVPGLNPVDVLGLALGPNLVTWLPVTFMSNKVMCND